MSTPTTAPHIADIPLNSPTGDKGAFSLHRGQHTVIIGRNGSGKASLLLAIRQAIPSALTTAEVSFREQHALIEQERQRDDSDLTDEVFHGTPLRELLREACPNASDNDIIQQCQHLHLEQVLDSGFRQLSSGETRKALLARALLKQANILLLYEPLSGIDQSSREHIRQTLIHAAEHCTIVLASSEEDALFHSLARQLIGLQAQSDNKVHALHNPATRQNDIHRYCTEILQTQLSTRTEAPLPPAPTATMQPAQGGAQSIKDTTSEATPEATPDTTPSSLVRMRHIVVRHEQRDILTLDHWSIAAGQHWQIRGANGSGKTTLLKLISGDHPQCYCNDIQLFGHQRGSGESIWEIKAKIGHMTSDLHWNYRVPGTALSVIVSGLYDSIGLYRNVSDKEKCLGQQWLAAIGMTDKAGTSFHQLSHGEQRLCLIARAMIKHPLLLLLDEPCQGLDAINRERVIALTEKLIQQSNTTLLYVSHENEAVIDSISHTLTLPQKHSAS